MLDILAAINFNTRGTGGVIPYVVVLLQAKNRYNQNYIAGILYEVFMKSDNEIQPSSATVHSEIRASWIGMAVFIVFFIMDWLAGWPI
jgi:hypothetical protein